MTFKINKSPRHPSIKAHRIMPIASKRFKKDRNQSTVQELSHLFYCVCVYIAVCITVLYVDVFIAHYLGRSRAPLPVNTWTLPTMPM